MLREIVTQQPVARVFLPLLQPMRYKGAEGGRGSGKSHFFGGQVVDRARAFPGERGGEGARIVCTREVQKSLKESAKRLIEDKLLALNLGPADGFNVFTDRIETPGDGLIIFVGMSDQTADSIKSLEGYDIAWCEEAQTISERSLMLLRPTIRAPGSELWFSWNPTRPVDPVDAMFKQRPPTRSVCVKANWRDNPWIPEELLQERLDSLRNEPDQYDHVWEGGYVTAQKGSYYAANLAEAKLNKRITFVPRDELMPIRAIFDIGFSDATVIWIVQYIGKSIRFIDYYEVVGQPLSAHVNWLRSNGYSAATCVLPHDGAQHDVFSGLKYEENLRNAGFDVRTIKNQGKGAAMKRIDAARRLFSRMWFDETKCRDGIAAIGWYHPNWDDKRLTDLGPYHDWSSHGADAFGLAAIDYEEPDETVHRPGRNRTGDPSGWMGA